MATHFITALVKNCASSARSSSSSVSSRDSDYRLILQNLTEDLLCTLYRTEWPAAELLLSSLCSQLVEAVKKRENPETLRLVGYVMH